MPFLNRTQLVVEFETPEAASADGIVIWGAGVDVESASRCRDFAQYFNTTLAPFLRKLDTEHT